MITKTLAILLTVSLSMSLDSTIAPQTVSVEIEYCDQNKGFEKSICSIQEAEYRSTNSLILDQKENLQAIIIDRRSMTLEKAEAIFGDGSIEIEERSIINIPYLQKSILIKPGTYPVQPLRKGYKIIF